MPQYKNASSAVVELEGIRIEPGQTVTTEKFIQKALPTGVTKESDSGYYDPTLLSQKVTTTSTVTVPSGISGNYRIILLCSAGDISMKVNSDSATARLMVAGDRVEWLCTSRVINDIRFTISSGTVYITIEKC